MLIRALAAFLAASLLALAAVGVIAKRQATQIGEIRAENNTLTDALNRAAEQRKRDQAALVLRAQNNAATARESASLRASLAEVLSRQREWAEEPVPEDVRKALE